MELFLQRLKKDPRLEVYHLVFLYVLIFEWQLGGHERALNVSRSIVMKATKIRSTATYHKYLRDLQDFGYVDYHRSYNPRFGSVFFINF